MTVQKQFKKLVRERMKKTGESYTSARRQMLKQSPIDPTTRFHFAGSIPATTALRVLLTAAGVRDPHTKAPFSEAMLFGIAGGVGIGVAAFRYEKEDFSSFFIAGRHLWFDDLAYLKRAVASFGLKAIVQETGGAKSADAQLRAALENGPVIAWVDMAHLPHRALPKEFSGGGYHVVPVYRVDDASKSAVIGDLTDEPISIPLSDFAIARAQIKKQAHRLLTIEKGDAKFDLAELVRQGLRTCHTALSAKPGKGPLAMSTLESLKRWRDRLANNKDKESWEKMYPPGANLWRGLTWLTLGIEWYGTGGGLCRPMMADFLTEAGAALGDARLTSLGKQYTQLGDVWSALANAALPDGVPLFRAEKEQRALYAELLSTNGTMEEKRALMAKLDELAVEAKRCFPLSEKQCADLRANLQERVSAIIAAEEAALAEMAAIAG